MSERRIGLRTLASVVLLLSGCTGGPAGQAGVDGGPPTDAASASPNDAATGGDDAGSTSADAATSDTRDAGRVHRPDAGTTPAPDAGTTPAPDAGSHPSADAGSTSTGGGSAGGCADLGTLPDAMSGLRCPDPPVISRDVTVTTAAELTSAAAMAGTRIHVVGAVGGNAQITANDIEVLADDATSIGRLSIARGISRVHVSGGAYTGVFVTQPAQYYPSPTTYRSGWMVTDVLFENMSVTSSDIAFEMRGRRIAVLHSRTDAARYSVWVGDTGPMQSEDIILFENTFNSAGPEATVRLVQVLRSATIGNTLVNTFKHNYRVHGISDLNYARGNMLINTGVMLGRLPGDVLGREWFDDNVFHHTAPDLFNPDAAISMLHATNNTAYTDVWSCFYCSTPQSGWVLSGNVVLPYTPPPAY